MQCFPLEGDERPQTFQLSSSARPQNFEKVEVFLARLEKLLNFQIPWDCALVGEGCAAATALSPSGAERAASRGLGASELRRGGGRGARQFFKITNDIQGLITQERDHEA